MFLRDRYAIAKALNFGKYPVILMDISTPDPGWDNVYTGDLVNADTGIVREGHTVYEHCTAKIFVDNNHEGIPNTIENRLKSDIWLQCPGYFISDSFGAEDVFEQAKRAQAPIVKANQDVVVVYKWENDNKPMAAVRIMTVSGVSRFCSTVAKLRGKNE